MARPARRVAWLAQHRKAAHSLAAESKWILRVFHVNGNLFEDQLLLLFLHGRCCDLAAAGRTQPMAAQPPAPRRFLALLGTIAIRRCWGSRASGTPGTAGSAPGRYPMVAHHAVEGTQVGGGR